jgi:DNA polymerase I-like protein with 3'-5' exonuclease and polymerase domains
MIVVDFETHGVETGVPPEPVGVAILRRGKARYYAWGHPTNNNCTKADAARALEEAWRSREPLLFHNAKFDLRVAYKFFNLPIPAWGRIHDTMFLSFLWSPHKTSSLKETAQRELGEAPSERDELAEWLVEQKIIPKKYSKENFGRNIWRTPGDLCGAYAIGDVTRTLGLYNHLLPKITEAGMLKAYTRECRLLPILIENERVGMRVDMAGLERDVPTFQAAKDACDRWARKRLKTPSLNVDAPDEVAAALKKCKVVTEFVQTPGGKDSISKVNLTFDMYKDQEVARVLAYRGKLETLLANSMVPWLDQARSNHGFISTEWNQVKAVDHGTRSGRLSCSRFQNIAKSVEGASYPAAPRVPPLPNVRRYILPDRGDAFIHRDYNQQEFRILAHFEGGELQEAYVNDPHLDYHVKMQELLWEVSHLKLERRPTKILNFGINYGMGIGKLAVSLGLAAKYACKPGCPHKVCKAAIEARSLRAAQKAAVPGVAELNRELIDLGKKGEAIRTWGGRLYYCEDPKMDGDRIVQTYEYKLLNYLIQGSAADCTKEALVRYHDHPKKSARFLVTVHDEINVSANKKLAKEQSEVLREVMESIEFDVPMLTDGKVGPNWGEIT